MIKARSPWCRDAGLIVVRSTISVCDLPVSADIGVYGHEIGWPQRLLVSAAFETLFPQSGRLKETVDYNDIVALAEKLGRERIALIETFAVRLAKGLLAYPNVLEVDVAVRKPGALSAGTAGARIVTRNA